jgi:hypothetical protein
MADEVAVAENPNAASDAGVTDSAPPSAADAVANALEAVKTKTERANDKLKGETDAPNTSKGPSTPEAGEADEAAAKRSEAAKKGAETKRKNAEAAKEAEAAEAAKASEDRVKEAEARAAKAEKAAEKAAAKAESQQPDAPVQASEGESTYTPPKEWSQEAKDDWANTPQSVQDQVSRMQGEFENGYAKHKESADKWSRVEPYEQLAAQFKADLPTVLEDYKNMSEMMRKNPIEGINYLAGRHGLSLTQLAEQVLERQGSESFKALEANYQKLHNYAKQLEARVKQIDDKQLTDNRNYIDTVRIKHRDNWDAIEADVQFMLQNHQGLGNTPNERLDNAVRKAYALNGLTFPGSEEVSKASAETVAEEKAESAETTKATTSAGSQSGTVPKTEGPAGSADEAVKRAFSKIRRR